MLTIRKRQPVIAEPTLDRNGTRRSPVTVRSYRLGKEPPNKGRTFPPEPLTPDEVHALMDACGANPIGIRNRALIMLMWRCGLRCSEALSLEPKDINLARGTVAVLRGKGRKSRIVAIDKGAGACIDIWMQLRPIYPAGPLFCVIQAASCGQRMHSSVLRETLKDLAVKAGIDKRVHPHGLRHSYASYLLDQGVPIHYIRRMLGHSSIAITEHYADHINPARVLDEMRKVPWPTH